MRIILLISSLLFAYSNVYAGGAESPDSLAKAFAEAFNNKDASRIADLTYFVDDSRGTSDKKKKKDLKKWEAQFITHAIKSHSISGLDSKDEKRAKPRKIKGKLIEYSLPLLKKLVINFHPFEAKHGSYKVIKYIGKEGGRFYFATHKATFE